MTKIHDTTPPTPRRARYFWPVVGQLDFRTAMVMEDGRYWRVMQLISGEALMTGFDSEVLAKSWAKSRGYDVLEAAI